MFHRNFFPYFLGSFVSNSGTWLQNIAQVLLVYRLTGSPFMVGVVNFAQFSGMLIVTPLGGVIADHFDRRRLLMTSQLGAVALSGMLAAVTAADLLTIPILIAFVIGLSITVALSTPSLQALVPSLVDHVDLRAAMALNAVTFNLARVIGPVVGALIVQTLGFGWAFGLNSLSYLSLLVGVSLVRPRSMAEGRPTEWPKAWDGIRLVRRNPQIAAGLAVGGAVSLAMDPLTTLGPAFASRIFGRSDTLVGFLIGVYGAGAVVAAFTSGWRPTTSYGRLGVMPGLMAVGMMGFALAPSLVVAIPALAIAGFGYLSSTTAATTQIHLSVPDEMRGRVMALWSLTFLGIRPLGSLIDGAVASVAGLRVAGLALGLPALAAAVLVARQARRRAPAEAK